MAESRVERVSFPMYDFDEVRPAHEALWSAVAKRLLRKTALVREGTTLEHWLHPDLLLTQTCGYPLTHELEGRVRVVATPWYRAPGCGEGSYSSAVVVHRDASARELADLRGKVCAINDRSSHSGMNVLRAMVAPLGMPFFASVVVTGSHAASLGAIQRRAADVCAIDAVTHALLARHRPSAVEGTRILCMTPAAPALPYVTRLDGPVDELRAALFDALRDSAFAETLLLEGVSVLDDDAYEAIRAFEWGAPLA